MSVPETAPKNHTFPETRQPPPSPPVSTSHDPSHESQPAVVSNLRRQRRPTRRVVPALDSTRARDARERRGDDEARSIVGRSSRGRDARNASRATRIRGDSIHSFVGLISFASIRSSSAREEEEDDDLDDDDDDELDDVDRARVRARVSRGWTGTRAREDATRRRGGETRRARARGRRRRER